MNGTRNTLSQFDCIIARCRELFERKMSDYGPSWRILRPESLTDQIFIKAKRIRTLETVEQAGLKEGDTISVKLVDIDAKTGKFKLSHKVLLPKPEGYEERPPRPERGPRSERGDRGPRQDRGDRGPRRERQD